MLPGVYIARKKDHTVYYRASVTYHGKHISLGSFDTEILAHMAYSEASHLLFNDSFTLDSLLANATSRKEKFFPGNSPSENTAASELEGNVLPFEKKVCLLNFRDNQIYFKNPIYLKRTYFLYFLTPDDELKFDVDDLFYYSSHKIMRRKGHLFVSDYGMQVTILSRYGIKNFAVAGKDYRFVNGDSTDFRYSNIEVLNRYYGVSRLTRNGQVCYKAQLHIKGNHVIGIYPTEALAAIAYNKAVDLARIHGITKNYTANYLTELSPKDYAALYTHVQISPRLLAYLKAYHHTP